MTLDDTQNIYTYAENTLKEMRTLLHNFQVAILNEEFRDARETLEYISSRATHHAMQVEMITGE